MSEEKCPQGQVQTALEKAADQREKSEASQQRELLKLTGGLRRISFYVTEREFSEIGRRAGGGTIEGLLEAFVSDLTQSERSIWHECQIEAQNWKSAHSRAKYAQGAFFKSLAEAEGGAKC